MTVSPKHSLRAAPLGHLGNLVKADPLLTILVFAAMVLAAIHPLTPARYAGLIDWPTLQALTGLLVLTRGIEHSGALQHAARALLTRVRSLRQLALLLVSLSAALSTVLTNDVSLFLVVPLTLGIARIAEVPLARLVIFEALAVNAGSALTPIGNPQNLLLWHQAGGSMLSYVHDMFPGVAIMSILLLVLTALMFAGTSITLNLPKEEAGIDRRLLSIAAGLLVLFLLLLELHAALPGMLLVLAVFALLFRDVLRAVDWKLLLIIGLMFIDLGALAALPALARLLPQLPLDQAPQVYWSGVLLSQFISNVPAAILLSPLTHLTAALALGVNVGGFGLAIGSLANLIALRQVGGLAIYKQFHLISLPFLVVVATAVYLLLLR
ncbi:MAG: citrate transporter [Nevskia sp.]|nr:citrate transporter [Nevskia sp.]